LFKKLYLLGNWLTDIGEKEINLIFMGVSALMWASWCTRNDLCLKKMDFFNYAGYFQMSILPTILIPIPA
jgi:hypothetical protein